MDVLSTLLGSLTAEDSVNVLAGKTGISMDKIIGLVKQAIPMLLAALKGNAASADGASSLLSALTQHTSQLSVADQLKEADAVDGGKIIGHILGANQEKVTSELAKLNGLDISQVTGLLSNLAPALMSSMSSLTSAAGDTQGLDLSSLTGLMGGLDVNSLLGSLGGSADALSGAFGALTGAAANMAGTAAGAAEDAAKEGKGLLDSILGFFKK